MKSGNLWIGCGLDGPVPDVVGEHPLHRVLLLPNVFPGFAEAIDDVRGFLVGAEFDFVKADVVRGELGKLKHRGDDAQPKLHGVAPLCPHVERIDQRNTSVDFAFAKMRGDGLKALTDRGGMIRPGAAYGEQNRRAEINP